MFGSNDGLVINWCSLHLYVSCGHMVFGTAVIGGERGGDSWSCGVVVLPHHGDPHHLLPLSVFQSLIALFLFYQNWTFSRFILFASPPALPLFTLPFICQQFSKHTSISSFSHQGLYHLSPHASQSQPLQRSFLIPDNRFYCSFQPFQVPGTF